MFHVPDPTRRADRQINLLNAAGQGHTQACCNLGLIYLKGTGIDQDLSAAKKWFAKGADQGFADAQYQLSLMYIEAQSVERDLVEAYMWLDLAVKQDHRGAMKARGKISQKLTPVEINDAEERSSKWKPATP